MINLNSYFSKFKLYKSKAPESSDLANYPAVDESFIECVKILGGKSYNEGIYLVFDELGVRKATELVWDLFPEYSSSVTVFGCDWLGRYFAVDARRLDLEKPQVLLLETGVGEAMQLPVSIDVFHNDELVEYSEDALSLAFFNEWKTKSNLGIELHECVGYKIPLFLGGEDIVSNLEIIDREVYTHICGQLRNQSLRLKEGQVIGDFKVID